MLQATVLSGIMSDTRDTQAERPIEDLGITVASLMNAVDKGTAEETTAHDLSPMEFNLLSICMRGGEHTATQLAEMLPVDASRISRVVTRLVDMGLLRRRRLRSDRRIVMLRLTERGHEVASLISQQVQTYNDKITQGITAEEIRGFEAAASKIIANYTALAQS